MEFLKMRRGEERVVEVMRGGVGTLFFKKNSQVMRVSGDGQRVVIYTPGSSRLFSSLCPSIVS